ncbi:MAG: response regulator [Planctomycetota bacterium]|jgi:DNA-binding response OmpR family regulator
MNAPPKKILVVDDDQSAVAFVRAALESEKYEVAGAVDGLAGLSQVRKDPPDLIILDVYMPRKTRKPKPFRLSCLPALASD